MAKILIVDDDLGIRELLQEILQDHGHEVFQAGNAAEASRLLRSCKPELVFLDIWMPDTGGLDLLRLWRKEGCCEAVVIVMSGQATIDAAIEATRQGALDFLEKPISLQKFLSAVARGLEHGRGFVSGSGEDAEAVAGAANGGAEGGKDNFQNKTVSSQRGKGRRATEGDGNIQLGSGAIHTAGQSLLRLDLPLREARELFEVNYFRFHLDAAEGNVAKVAKRTGLERTNLYRKLHSLNLLRAEDRN